MTPSAGSQFKTSNSHPLLEQDGTALSFGHLWSCSEIVSASLRSSALPRFQMRGRVRFRGSLGVPSRPEQRRDVVFGPERNDTWQWYLSYFQWFQETILRSNLSFKSPCRADWLPRWRWEASVNQAYHNNTTVIQRKYVGQVDPKLQFFRCSMS